MSTALRPTWWSYPAQCPAGHPWAPGRVIVGWMPCDCPAAAREPGHGHLWVRCRAGGCREIWYRPEHCPLAARLHGAWLDAHADWGPGQHEDGFGLHPSDDTGSPDGFAAWVGRLTAARDLATFRWIVEDQRVLGGIALRHHWNDYVRWAGHIGYGIRPAARRRGLAGWALGQMLDTARAQGLDRVLVVCATGNVASARTIERAGGVFEEIRDTEYGAVRRYWITTGEPDA